MNLIQSDAPVPLGTLDLRLWRMCEVLHAAPQYSSSVIAAARSEPTTAASNKLQRLGTRMPVLPDNEMVVHRDTERARDLHDRLRHLDIGARGGRITRGMVVQKQVT